MHIIDFLHARITEDETTAREASTTVNERMLYNENMPAGESWDGDDGMVSGVQGQHLWDCEGSSTLCVAPAVSLHMAHNDPARVLAECKAKRAILKLHGNMNAGFSPEIACCESCHDYGRNDAASWPCPTIHHLAAVYNTHPGYIQEWAP